MAETTTPTAEKPQHQGKGEAPLSSVDGASSAATTPAGSPAGHHPRPCPKDCRRCSMAQQICCASMLSFQMYDVLNIVIQRLDTQQQTIADLSARLSAIQSSEAELSEPLPIQPDLFPSE